MTRINLVDPIELMDQHLTTEYLENPRIPIQLLRSINARGVDGVMKMIPKEFTLGKGHVSFFYDKGSYLVDRYMDLSRELTRRGFPHDRLMSYDSVGVYQQYPQFFKGYIETPGALVIIRQRIAEKIALKPHWYLYERKPIQ